jgi:hypothetical protein
MAANWLTPANIKWILTVLAIPLALAIISRAYESNATRQQTLDARLRLYTELLARREEADTGIRKDMFGKVLDNFLTPAGNDLERQLVAVELLALNFNDSLNLSPLFRRLERQIEAQPLAQKDLWLGQLERVARDVKERQVETLEVVGARANGTIDFHELDAGGALPIVDKDLVLHDPMAAELDGATGNIKRHFSVEVLERVPPSIVFWCAWTTTRGNGRSGLSPSTFPWSILRESQAPSVLPWC